MNVPTRAPAPLQRPKFAQFLWERNLNNEDAAQALGRTREWVRLISLPFDDPRRRIPSEDDIRLIVAWTEGQVTASDFYPPDLREGVREQREAAQ
jgi:hypothetical protein